MGPAVLTEHTASTGVPESLLHRPKKQTKAERVYRALRYQIMTSQLPPGSAVSERLLAERLQSGMAPVRVAIQRLAAEGFLAIEPRRGIRISQHSVQDILDLFQVRVVMEQLVVRKIAGTLDEPQIERLHENLDEYQAAASVPDVDLMIAADFQFHQLLAEIHGNKQLAVMLDRILDSLFREIRNSMKVRRRTTERLAEHQQIVDALIRGDADAAECTLVAHLQSGQRFVMTGGEELLTSPEE